MSVCTGDVRRLRCVHMAQIGELSFQQFLEHRSTLQTNQDPNERTPEYAYVSDRAAHSAFENARALENLMEAAVRVGKKFSNHDLLGRAVKVGPNQFPRVHRLARQCADTLGIAVPTIFVVNSPVMNAGTLGTNDDSFIMVHSALIDAFSDEELLSVIGHECGHIHNRHVVYLSALSYLSGLAKVFLDWIMVPARVALLGYQRRAEITCDRAGLLCCKDIEVSTRALTKLALGSSKLYEQLNMEAFIDQYREGREEMLGAMGEFGASHPYLPKRVLSLREFAESALYRKHAGLGDGGRTMKEVDDRVHDIIKVVV